MSDIAKDEVRDRLGNIDQIRDIIFGSQVREYDNRLSKIETDLSLLQQDTRDRIEHLRANVEAELRSAVESLEKKLKAYSATAQAEGLEIRHQVDRLNKKFTTSLQAFDEAVDRQFESVRTELTDSKTKLQDDANALRDLVFDELNRRFSQLQEAKVSRNDIAETLFELGMRLKGTEFVPTLREAGENEEFETVPLLATRKHIEEIVHAG